MTIDCIDPPELAPIIGSAHATVAKGSTVIHLSGQTGVDQDGQVVGSTFREQAEQALRNLEVALRSTGAGPGDVAKLTIYIKDYTPDLVEPLLEAALSALGDAYPVTATTLVGVAELWQPELLVEVDAVAVV